MSIHNILFIEKSGQLSLNCHQISVLHKTYVVGTPYNCNVEANEYPQHTFFFLLRNRDNYP